MSCSTQSLTLGYSLCIHTLLCDIFHSSCHTMSRRSWTLFLIASCSTGATSLCNCRIVSWSCQMFTLSLKIWRFFYFRLLVIPQPRFFVLPVPNLCSSSTRLLFSVPGCRLFLTRSDLPPSPSSRRHPQMLQQRLL